ncbi:hypothetical protein EVAR_44374_1 [Eumeta japonica]|uniref:Uncharacterized protein n=1 Tax=Eumeta variegata TaxID=151549 RepID=A0A4C1X9V2_EUMVA|nr:hypothetical protein EVAR_44374_1 [Eumeta japonica]
MILAIQACQIYELRFIFSGQWTSINFQICNPKASSLFAFRQWDSKEARSMRVSRQSHKAAPPSSPGALNYSGDNVPECLICSRNFGRNPSPRRAPPAGGC